MSDRPTRADLPTLGLVRLPPKGTPVGSFEFVVNNNEGRHVEVGAAVSAETAEGVFTGVVTDMHTVGSDTNPVALDHSGQVDEEPTAPLQAEVVLATVQVFAAPANRPARVGRVRAATADEVATATGADRVDWPVPAGVVKLIGGELAPVNYDGHALLGPQSAHMMIGGISGQAAKTSYATVMLRSSIAAGQRSGESVAALLFNTKGHDLCFLDRPPKERDQLTDDDVAMYTAMGVPAEPFDHLELWSPALPGTDRTRSPRDDALVLRWDLRTIWPHLRYITPDLFTDEKSPTAGAFLAEFRDHVLHGNARFGEEQVRTFDELERWFNRKLGEVSEGGPREGEPPWRNHHLATFLMVRRRLMGIPAKFKGLVTSGEAGSAEDVPVTGWSHGQVVVVDLAGLGEEVQSVVIARTLERLFNQANDEGIGVGHLVVWADELNTFAPSRGREMAQVRRTLQTISTQGRAAGLSLWGMGQMLSKVDELVRDNASTRALGMTNPSEIASDTYGRVSPGLAATISDLDRGEMVLWHYTLKAPLPVSFPRPAWQTGIDTSAGRRAATVDALSDDGGSSRRPELLTEGIPPERVEEIIASSATLEEAEGRLERERVPDLRAHSITEPREPVDDPFRLDAEPAAE